MVEIFIFPAVLIGVTSKVWKSSISQLPSSYLLDGLISEESESQPNYFNKIFSFSRGGEKYAETKIDHLETCHFSLLTLVSFVDRGSGPMVQSSYVIIKRSLKSNL